MPARPASSAHGVPPASPRRLVVAVRSRASGDVLEVSAQTGGVVGSFDPRTGQLEVLESHDSVAVAAAVGPYLLAPDQPLGTLSARHVAAADRLWAILEASAFTWQRYVPVHDRLLLFYCPLVRLALEIVEDIERDDDADGLGELGLFRAPVQLTELEQHPAAVAARLNAICRARADNRPGAKATRVTPSPKRRTVRVRRPPRP